MMTSRQRIKQAILSQPVDQIPVIIPGGMMAGTLTEILEKEAYPYPGIHTDGSLMAKYSEMLRAITGIDNTGVPFCMTIEAECYGATVDLGSITHEPRIAKAPFDNLTSLLSTTPEVTPRYHETIKAVRLLSKGDSVVIGNITGPMSILTSLVDQGVVYRAMERDTRLITSVLESLSNWIVRYGEDMCNAGADVIVMSDPSSAGDIVGPDYFKEALAPNYRSILTRLKKNNTPVILHICGRINPLVREIGKLPWDALSVDSMVGLKQLKREFKDRPLMGNVSTHLLAEGSPPRIYRNATKAAELASILSPACGVSTKTPVQNIQAMVRSVSHSRQVSPEEGPNHGTLKTKKT